MGLMGRMGEMRRMPFSPPLFFLSLLLRVSASPRLRVYRLLHPNRSARQRRGFPLAGRALAERVQRGLGGPEQRLRIQSHAERDGDQDGDDERLARRQVGQPPALLRPALRFGAGRVSAVSSLCMKRALTATGSRSRAW